MNSNHYIKDKKKLIEALYEESFGVSIDALTEKWKDFTGLSLSAAKEGKLLFAYHLAQEFKEELAFYPYLAYQVACHHDFPWGEFEHDVLVDMLPYCHNEELKHHAERAICSIEARIEDEYNRVGFTDEAKPYVQNLQMLYDALGEEVTLHDAVVCKIDYDREQERATVLIDTWTCWDGHRASYVTLRFDGILDIKWDADISSDYASDFVCYHLNQCGGCIVFLIRSVDFRVSCKSMTVLSVEEHD